MSLTNDRLRAVLYCEEEPFRRGLLRGLILARTVLEDADADTVPVQKAIDALCGIHGHLLMAEHNASGAAIRESHWKAFEEHLPLDPDYDPETSNAWP